MLSTSSKNWLEVEDHENLSENERAELRRLLFGESDPDLCYSINPEQVRALKRASVGAGGDYRQIASRLPCLKTGYLKLEASGYDRGFFIASKSYCLSSDDQDSLSKFKAIASRGCLSEDVYKFIVDSEERCQPHNLVENRIELKARDGISLVESQRLATSSRSRLQCKYKTVELPNEMHAFD